MGELTPQARTTGPGCRFCKPRDRNEQYYSVYYRFRARNCSEYTSGLLLVAGVLVGVAMPLRIASTPINALLSDA